jgi:hypothetical protein
LPETSYALAVTVAAAIAALVTGSMLTIPKLDNAARLNLTLHRIASVGAGIATAMAVRLLSQR